MQALKLVVSAICWLRGCHRLGLLHTTPKSKHAVVLISQEKSLPRCDANEVSEVLYPSCEEARADIKLTESPISEGAWQVGEV